MESITILEKFKNIDFNNSDTELKSFYLTVISIVSSTNYKELYKYALQFLDKDSRAVYMFDEAYLKHLKYANYEIDYFWLKLTETKINCNPKKIIKKKFRIRGAQSAFSSGKSKKPKNIDQFQKKSINNKIIYIAKRT